MHRLQKCSARTGSVMGGILGISLMGWNVLEMINSWDDDTKNPWPIKILGGAVLPVMFATIAPILGFMYGLGVGTIALTIQNKCFPENIALINNMDNEANYGAINDNKHSIIPITYDALSRGL